jgi:hypothetical protein
MIMPGAKSTTSGTEGLLRRLDPDPGRVETGKLFMGTKAKSYVRVHPWRGWNSYE